jgi:hypothetical protein
MTVKPATTLPPQWVERQTADGGTELRNRSRGRRYLVGVLLFLLLILVVRAVRLWPLPTDQRNWSLGISAVLVVFAVWCAYAEVYWRVGTGYLERYLDFGTWKRVRRYENAGLEIVTGRSSEDTPFYSLYAAVDGKRHLLFESLIMDDIVQLARYIAAHTGFRTF